MPDSNTAAQPVVYQLRSSCAASARWIWRRLLVRGDSTIADLHRTLQVAFGWSDEYFHRFVIHGREHGAESLIDPRRVHLADLGFRLQERFVYEYNFIGVGSTTCASSRSCRSRRVESIHAVLADGVESPRGLRRSVDLPRAA
jgi:hypothetical protein